VFGPYLASHASAVGGTSNLAISSHAAVPVQVSSKSVGIEGHFTLEAGKFFAPVSRYILAESLTHHTWHSLPMRHYQCKRGRNRSVLKGTLLLRSEQFSPVSRRILAQSLEHHAWHSLPNRHYQCKFGRNRSVSKALNTTGQNSFPPISRIAFQRGG
jgi:hypothetical protein